MIYYLIAGVLIGYIIPHYKIYETACNHFLKCIRHRDKKINELMIENNKLKKQITMENENFLEKVWDFVTNIFSKSTSVLKDIAHIANDFVNKLKALEASPAGQAIETIIEIAIPPTTGLINAFKLAFPKVQSVLANIEGGKTGAEVEQLFLKWLTGLKTSDPVLYAGTLTTLNTWVQKFLADNQGLLLPVENALTNATIVHKAASAPDGDPLPKDPAHPDKP